MTISSLEGDTVQFAGKSSAPSAPEGAIYYDTTLQYFQFYNGSVWVTL